MIESPSFIDCLDFQNFMERIVESIAIAAYSVFVE